MHRELKEVKPSLGYERTSAKALAGGVAVMFIPLRSTEAGTG